MGKPLTFLDLDFDRTNISLRFPCTFGGMGKKTIKDLVEIDSNRILVLTYKPPEYFIVDIRKKVVVALGQGTG